MIDIFAASGKAARKAKQAVTFSIDKMQGLKRGELKVLAAAIRGRLWRLVQTP